MRVGLRMYPHGSLFYIIEYKRPGKRWRLARFAVLRDLYVVKKEAEGVARICQERSPDGTRYRATPCARVRYP